MVVRKFSPTLSASLVLIGLAKLETSYSLAFAFLVVLILVFASFAMIELLEVSRQFNNREMGGVLLSPSLHIERARPKKSRLFYLTFF